MAEYYRDQRIDVMLFVDNIFRYILAGAEVSVLLDRMPSLGGYQPTLAADLAAFEERITSTSKASITSIQAFYLPADDYTDPAPVATFAHFDTVIALERSLFERGYYPAVNPLASTSWLLNANTVGIDHFDTAREAQKILQRYEDLRPIMNIIGIHELSDEDQIIVARAQKIKNFCTQPLYVAEQFTGIGGEYVPIDKTVQGFKEIIEGKWDEIPEKAFYMIGSIDKAAKKLE
jgi:F-type H+-transporting ATPase subunit beta